MSTGRAGHFLVFVKVDASQACPEEESSTAALLQALDLAGLFAARFSLTPPNSPARHHIASPSTLIAVRADSFLTIIDLRITHVRAACSDIVPIPHPLRPPHRPLDTLHPTLDVSDEPSVAHDARLIPPADDSLAAGAQGGDLGVLRELRDLEALHAGEQGGKLGGQGRVRDGDVGCDGGEGGDGAGKGGREGEDGGAEGGDVELRRRLGVGGGGGSEKGGMGAVCFWEDGMCVRRESRYMARA